MLHLRHSYTIKWIILFFSHIIWTWITCEDLSNSFSFFFIVTSGPSSAVVPNTSSRKKALTSKTEMHEHKKTTGKKKWILTGAGTPYTHKIMCSLGQKKTHSKPWLKLSKQVVSSLYFSFYISVFI